LGTGGDPVERLDVGGNALIRGRLLESMGTTVNAANDLTLGTGGNTFLIAGNTQINGIATAGWNAGNRIILIFSGTPTVKHNTAATAGFARIFLAGSADLPTVVNTVLELVYDGTQWQQISVKTP